MHPGYKSWFSYNCPGSGDFMETEAESWRGDFDCPDIHFSNWMDELSCSHAIEATK